MPQYSAQKRWYVPGFVASNQTVGVAAGHRVLLDAERGHVEAVDHVLGGHGQLHRAADRHVQLVDLALAVEVLHLPHPLLADDVDLQRVVRAGA